MGWSLHVIARRGRSRQAAVSKAGRPPRTLPKERAAALPVTSALELCVPLGPSHLMCNALVKALKPSITAAHWGIFAAGQAVGVMTATEDSPPDLTSEATFLIPCSAAAV
eukprot:Skav211813  [mRNA]  locus=scaffold305:517572:517901:- [translate_table: standard]